MVELEKTFLIKYLPQGWRKSPSKKIFDLYFPFEAEHPVLRLRSSEGRCEFTKKEPIKERDSSRQLETTIVLSKKECQTFSKLKGKVSSKIRYYYSYKKHVAEITVFLGKLRGLILVDFEFSSLRDMKIFKMPDFCLADVTQEKFMAGGMIAGKSYKDLKKELNNYGYKRIFV